jgi:hypothetical protein
MPYMPRLGTIAEKGDAPLLAEREGETVKPELFALISSAVIAMIFSSWALFWFLLLAFDLVEDLAKHDKRSGWRE